KSAARAKSEAAGTAHRPASEAEPDASPESELDAQAKAADPATGIEAAPERPDLTARFTQPALTVVRQSPTREERSAVVAEASARAFQDGSPIAAVAVAAPARPFRGLAVAVSPPITPEPDMHPLAAPPVAAPECLG